MKDVETNQVVIEFVFPAVGDIHDDKPAVIKFHDIPEDTFI